MMGNTKQSVTEKMIMPFRFAACPLSLKCIIVLNLNKRDFVSLAPQPCISLKIRVTGMTIPFLF